MSTDALPFVTVIMPVRDAARHLPQTLRALLAGDYPADRMEVLVVDGASRDGTAGLIDDLARVEPRVRRLVNPSGTAPAGLNLGLRAARGAVVVRLDAHARPEADYVAACVRALVRTGADAVGGPMVGVGETGFGRAVAIAQASPLGAGSAAYRRGGAGPVDTVYLGAWRRELFERVGLFDEGLSRNQDYELCERIRRAGGVVWLDPAIRTRTVTRASPAALARQYFGYGQGRAATWRRHPGSLRLRQVIPAAFTAGLFALAAALPFLPAARRLLALALAGYGAVVLVSAQRAAAGTDPSADRPGTTRRLWLVYPILHGAWGAGFWLGLARALRARAMTAGR